MAKKLLLIVTLLHFSMSIYSQKILTDIGKYDLTKIERQVIKKSRKLLKTDKERKLFAFTYFTVEFTDCLFLEDGDYDNFLNSFKSLGKYDGTVDDFLKYFKLYDKYRCYVYDDSLNIIATAWGTNVFPYSNTTPDNRYIEHITRINPKYIFEYIYCPTSCPMYFCYKDGEIIIVHLSDDGESIVSYPLFGEVNTKVSDNSDNTPLLNYNESSYLNKIFEATRKDFDFTNKKVGFLTGSLGKTMSSREHYFNMHKKHSTNANSPCDNGTLYTFNAEQKSESGGYDAAIVYWNKFVTPIETVVERLKKKH